VRAVRLCERFVTNISINSRGGVLLYAGELGGQDITLSGKTDFISMSATRDPFYPQNVIHVSASLNHADMKWETETTKLPVDPEALVALARNHRVEYDDLCEKLTILRALGG
jgi:hypothetical protein